MLCMDLETLGVQIRVLSMINVIIYWQEILRNLANDW